ncbi:MAG TPA: helical backbone metal receptor [Kofleriaceae bacterium]|nr:helical backbone metal receptor [Kofleriaceae bacterium]
MRWLATRFVLGIVLAFVLPACSKSEPASGAPSRELRLVSLTPSATEVVAALGATDQLVGVDEYSTYPPSVKALPKVGSFLSPNLEVIVGLRPSVVIVDDVHGSTAGALRDAKIETLAVAIHGLPDVKRALKEVGARIGRTAEADRAIAEIDGALDAMAASRPAKRPRVLAIIDREAGGLGNLVAAGPGSWLDELLAVVGAENVLAASGVRYPKLSLEEVLRGEPDVILDLSYGATADPWRTLAIPAAKTGRIVTLAEPYLVAPSPRVKQALDALAAAVRGP